jgi:hypothetical protein
VLHCAHFLLLCCHPSSYAKRGRDPSPSFAKDLSFLVFPGATDWPEIPWQGNPGLRPQRPDDGATGGKEQMLALVGIGNAQKGLPEPGNSSKSAINCATKPKK